MLDVFTSFDYIIEIMIVLKPVCVLLFLRERGARALEERLATERLAAAKGADGSHIDASEEV